MSAPDDVDALLDQLKTLPLIAAADLDADSAAYDAFELVLGAILRAALLQVPDAERRGHNRELFERFVVERFPPGHGYGDAVYANRLWEFRNAVVKNKQTATFVLIHSNPQSHPGTDNNGTIVLLDLHGLIADFYAAVDNLGELLRSTPEMRALASSELAARTIRLIPVQLQ
jgi:hypothetical protein